MFLLKQKSDTAKTLKNFCSMVKRQFDTEIKCFRSDNAKDFCNNELKEFFEHQGIRHETSCPYTPQNGLAERKIGDIMNRCTTLMIASNIPRNLWGFAILTAVYLINRVPSKGLNLRTPVELIDEKFPMIQQRERLKPRIFGCIGYVLSHDRNQDKLSPRAHKCVFVGYSYTQKGYRLYHPTTKGVFVSKDVTFDENTFFYSRQPGHNDPGFLDATPDKEDNMILETPDIIGSEQVGYSTDTPRTDQNLTAESDNDILEPEGSEHQFQYYPKLYERKKKGSKESTKDVRELMLPKKNPLLQIKQ